MGNESDYLAGGFNMFQRCGKGSQQQPAAVAAFVWMLMAGANHWYLMSLNNLIYPG